MEQVGVKVAGDTRTSSEFNNMPSQELQNVVSNPGITFNTNDLTQLSQGINRLVSNSMTYNENGVVDAYNLPPSWGTTDITAYFEGMVVITIVDNTNTGASTIDVSNIGVVSLLDADGGALVGGEVLSTLAMRAFHTGGAFRLITIDGDDVELKNNLANQTNPNEGDRLVGHTNTTVYNASPRAFGYVKVVGNAYVLQPGSYNVASVQTIEGGVSAVFLNEPMDTTNYIVIVSSESNPDATAPQFKYINAGYNITGTNSFTVITKFGNILQPFNGRSTQSYSFEIYEFR